MTGAQVLVRTLEAQGVRHVFGIPGAKIDAVFDALRDSSIQTVVCRHEQNAGFIAAALGRMTGTAGVVLVTSGPGCSNLATALATANTEGDPVVAIGGAVPTASALKRVHQSLDTIALFRPITKYTAEIDSAQTISEVVANAFRVAQSPRAGAAFVSARADVMADEASDEILTPADVCRPGSADPQAVAAAAAAIAQAQLPVLFLGMAASAPDNAAAIGELLQKAGLPVVGTYQASGVVPRALFGQFGGRVGLFRNQPGDQLLDAADVVITIGYDPVEYEPALWNAGKNRSIIHLDECDADIDRSYRPAFRLVGDIASTVRALTGALPPLHLHRHSAFLDACAADRAEFARASAMMNGAPIHPMRIVHELQPFLDGDTTLCSDMGSFHIWMARHLYSFRPRQILMTNGQQTLGVGLPWAIAASLARPNQRVLSVSGDGGFLFSAMELETAVRLKCRFVHLVLVDGSYDMVKFQEMAKYGRSSGVDFGPVDVVAYAQAFGAAGVRIRNADEISPKLERAFSMDGPVLVEIPVDYRDNLRLLESVHPEVFI